MQVNSLDLEPKLFPANPLARDFPPEWRDIWFRRYSKSDKNGIPHYECPVCQRLFDHSNIRYLHGDHIWPYSLFGETSWGNYRLICGSCNLIKSNLIDLDVRLVLSTGAFRELVKNHLAQAVEDGKLQKHLVLKDIVGK